MGALRASLGQALESKSVLEGLPRSGGPEEAGSAAYVKRAAREAHNILNGMLA